MNKRVLSLLLATIMLFSCLPFSVFAANSNGPKITVVSQYAAPNSSVQVDMKITNNPGVAGTTLTVAYDSKLTLTDAVSNGVFSDLGFTKPGKFESPCNFIYDSEAEVASEDGVFLSLSFIVSAEVNQGESLPVTVSYRNGDIFDSSMENIYPSIENGIITVINYIPGDVNGDKSINGKDVTLIRRFIAGGYDVIINEDAADVNDDNVINGKDVTLIRRYNAGGYNVELKPHTLRCAHNMTSYEAVDATCEENGNIAYWYCSICDKFFTDEDGNYEISFEDTVVAAKGHTVVIDPAVPATDTSTGLTEGSHCAICLKVLAEQTVTPIVTPQTANIVYKLFDNDNYLASQMINNPNPNKYIIGKGVMLSNDIEVPGYTFLGWYDSFADNATQIKSISVTETNDITLYAHWKRHEYTIQYESDLISVNDDVYTVNQSKQLPTPQLDGYIFVGWSDGDGKIIRRIPVGTVGDKIYSANWMSERNKAWSRKNIDDPIIIEDDSTDTILFTYEIGEIQNVPLYVIEDFGYVNSEGVSKTVSKEYSVKTNTTLMNQYTKTVANSTTNSAQWSLSNGWTDSVTVTENYLEENELDIEEAKVLCATDSNNWLVSSGSSGSSTTTKYASAQEYDLNTATDNTKTYDTHNSTDSKTHKQSAELKLSAKESAGINVAGTGAKAEFSQELDVGYEGSHTNSTADKTGTESDQGSQDQTGSVKHTGTDTVNTGGWNSSRSYGGSKTVSNTDSISKTISEKIATEKGYGNTYILSGNQDETQGTSSSTTDSSAYSSAVTYSIEEATKETITYSTSNTKTGYHRLVKAGTAHVFAIVGYDIKTASYFANTFTVMDTEYHNFEDYSYTTASYDDNQISVIPFEVPYEVEEYVLSKVGETEGLEFNGNGVVTSYSGTETAVIIPEYHVVDNLDGTKSVLKVTGISTSAFKGKNNITGIQLSDYIGVIPANAFENCENLRLINMPHVINIGENAFVGCDFDSVFLSQTLDVLGNNAFDNIEYFAVQTNKLSVIEGAINSGAKNIAIHVTLAGNSFDGKQINVGSNIETFIFYGYGNQFNNFSIESNASITVINRAIIDSNTGVPIKSSSRDIQFGQVVINSPGFSMILTNEESNLYLYGESSVNSSKGNAVLCKSVNVIKTEKAIQKGVFSELQTKGNIMYCDSYSGDDYVRFTNGGFVKISEAEYNKYLNGVYTLTFDANGGAISESSKTIYYGESIGSLPTPTREGFTFDGWYTAKTDGTKITEATVSSFDADTTVYAHWIVNAFTAKWNNGTGYTITVKRTSSPNKGAATGNINSGTTVYYGDVLSITYTKADYYTITSSGKTSITVTHDVTPSEIYATATQNAVSGWVLSSNAPSGAQIVNTKYTYTHRYYDSRSTYPLSGWTHYRTSDPIYGSWSGNQTTTSAPATSDTLQIVGQSTTYNYYHWCSKYNDKWNVDSCYVNSTSKKHTYSTTNPLPSYKINADKGGKANQAYGYQGCTNAHKCDYNFYTWWLESSVTTYTYQTRSKSYIYYYYQDRSEESSSYPGGSDISNIQTWVQYRAK